MLRKFVKISPCVGQKQLRFGDDVGARDFVRFARQYHQQLEDKDEQRCHDPPC